MGGGTDFPEVYLKHGGCVVGGAIDKFCYVSVRKLPPYHQFKTKLAYSLVETVQNTEEIQHPLIRACIEYMKIEYGLEIHYASDMPGRSGIGSSSSFAVGLLQGLAALEGKARLAHQLANDAVEIERNILKEAGGHQDQQWAAHGGLNYIRFEPSGSVNIYPLVIGQEALADFESHLMLFYTGHSRDSAQVTNGYKGRLATDARYQWAMMGLADEGVSAIQRKDWMKLGKLMDMSWGLKRDLNGVTNPQIDLLYATARLHGAVGGKLLGAGGGGCMLLVVPPEKASQVKEGLTLAGMVPIPFRFEFDGSRVIFADRNSF